MKKCITWIAMLAVAGVATAGLNDPSFEDATDFVARNNNKMDETLSGWQAHATVTDVIYDEANDRISYPIKKTGIRGFGQVIAGSAFGAGDVTLELDYDLLDGVGSADIEVRVYGVSGTFSGMEMYNLVAGGNNVLLGTASLLDPGTSVGTLVVDLNLGDALNTYDYIQVGASVVRADTAGHAYIDRVEIGSGAPAPQMGSLFVIK